MSFDDAIPRDGSPTLSAGQLIHALRPVTAETPESTHTRSASTASTPGATRDPITATLTASSEASAAQVASQSLNSGTPGKSGKQGGQADSASLVSVVGPSKFDSPETADSADVTPSWLRRTARAAIRQPGLSLSVLLVAFVLAWAVAPAAFTG